MRVWASSARAVTQSIGLLELAGSAWRVNSTKSGLERRVDPTSTAAAQATIAASSREPSEHLSAAWAAAYGRSPDPDKAYAEAVKAVDVDPAQPGRVIWNG